MGRPVRVAALAVAFLSSAAAPVRAAQYPGWGDTGWVYASKRDCCDAGIALAQQYSMQACADTGGVPKPTAGGQRGTCRWQWMQDSGGTILYRCYGEAAVWCR